MRGTNTMTLNADTVRGALEYWLNREVSGARRWRWDVRTEILKRYDAALAAGRDEVIAAAREWHTDARHGDPLCPVCTAVAKLNKLEGK